jgi:hypothetical protein
MAAVPMIAVAKDLPCSVKASRLDADTKKQAGVDDKAARATALAEIKAAGAKISSGGLEVEDGCLLYTYDVKVPGRSGVGKSSSMRARGRCSRSSTNRRRRKPPRRPRTR